MKILAIDTSATSAGVAIVEDGKILSESFINTTLTHSGTLMPMVDCTLKNAKIELDSIDYFACSVGPGSFTGIRIGISALKGMADALDKKCLPVSTLEAIAYNLVGQDVVAVSVMDARCNQVYCAIFDIDGETVTRLTDDEAIKIDELAMELENYDKQIVFVGDGAKLCHGKLGYKMASAANVYQKASSVAFAAEKQYSEDKLITGEKLVPVYLRLSQAERELKAKNDLKK
ncbi:MAG: tRNA (adenosine(37)-N6)-threonylcarbamoyltransferase complex dimerization subunit type 1 TsaB [Clostridia bacterium]